MCTSLTPWKLGSSVQCLRTTIATLSVSIVTSPTPASRLSIPNTMFIKETSTSLQILSAQNEAKRSKTKGRPDKRSRRPSQPHHSFQDQVVPQLQKQKTR
ncbi:hypothetical protein V6Z11_A09G051800 [Gossypium hirsutum]|uniref:Uncharacterized protein isoform X3 n=1 Tax=Gossypium hirsutum TaxID=3635 RepID=A0A1U8HYS2_GOSHI|nr:uncharacterized protein LOC107888801 isoform X3 [Gossypium hirsutum]